MLLRPTNAMVWMLACLLSVISIRCADGAEPPEDRVVAMYFHRTQRCPTCKKMGSYAQDTIKTRFADQVKAKTVEFHFIDYESKKNSKLTKAYKVTGPALIVARVRNNKVVEFKDMEEIWSKVGDKESFCEYVEAGVTKYQKKRKGK